MEQDLQQTIALLSRTPAALDALLRGLPDAWTRHPESEGTWSAFDVIVHLIHCEQDDWIPRARTILQSGETQPFAPFDRWANIGESQGAPLDSFLDEFARRRHDNLAELTSWNLQPEDFTRRGRHPALGVVTLSQLLATWAVHDLSHLHQIARVMAFQYSDAVGPWSQYLGVLQCVGHSAP